MRRKEHAARGAVSSRGERTQVLAAGAAALLALGWFYAIDPGDSRLFFKCPLYAHTGLYCAGCGGQRALHALLHGQVAEALSQNLVAVLVVAPLAAYCYAAWALGAFAGVRLPVPGITLARVLVLLALLLAYAVLRNLPAYDWLRPA